MEVVAGLALAYGFCKDTNSLVETVTGKSIASHCTTLCKGLTNHFFKQSKNLGGKKAVAVASAVVGATAAGVGGLAAAAASRRPLQRRKSKFLGGDSFNRGKAPVKSAETAQAPPSSQAMYTALAEAVAACADSLTPLQGDHPAAEDANVKRQLATLLSFLQNLTDQIGGLKVLESEGQMDAAVILSTDKSQAALAQLHALQGGLMIALQLKLGAQIAAGSALSAIRAHKAAAPPELPAIVKAMLRKPNADYTIEQKIECITACIQEGDDAAMETKDEDILIILGNTGAGKSTFINWLHGCTMQLKRKRDIGMRGTGEVCIVEPDSDPGEMMAIGHSKASMTFIPGVQRDENFVYVDCPGFLDNRGCSVNIANATNIKLTVGRAKTVRVIILCNFADVTSTRGRALRELMNMVVKMFGGVENLESRAASVVFAIGRVPEDDLASDVLQEVFGEGFDDDENPDGFGEETQRVLDALKGNACCVDVLGSDDETRKTREEMIHIIKSLEPMDDHSSILQVPLTDSDTIALNDIVEEVRSQLDASYEEGRFVEVAQTLRLMSNLEVIKNPVVTSHLEKICEDTHEDVEELFHAAHMKMLAEDFEGAATARHKLDDFLQALMEYSFDVLRVEHLVKAMKRKSEELASMETTLKQKKMDEEQREAARKKAEEEREKKRQEALERNRIENERLAAELRAQEKRIAQLSSSNNHRERQYAQTRYQQTKAVAAARTKPRRKNMVEKFFGFFGF